MTAAALTPVLAGLTFMAWVSVVLLLWIANNGPRIAVLTERTVIAIELAILGTVASMLRYNTDTGYSLFPQPLASLIFAVTIMALLVTPTVWVVLFALGRLK